MSQTVQAYRRKRARDWRDPFSWFNWFLRDVKPTVLFRYDVASGRDTGTETFTRASAASYVDGSGVIKSAASGIKRDQHYINGQGPYLLLEGARTNSILQSENFSHAAWSAPNVTVSVDAITAPNGTLTADKIVETAATTTFYASQNDTPGAATYTTSVFAKAAERSWLNITVHQDSSYIQSYFNLATGVAGTAGAGCTLRIEPFGNGWYRCSVTRATATTDSYAMYYVALADNDNSVFVGRLGVAGSGLYLWGAERQVGAFPSSYIPTTTAAVTRVTDYPKFVYTPLPGPQTLFVKMVDLNGSDASTHYIAMLCDAAANTPYHSIQDNGSGAIAATHYGSVGRSTNGVGTIVIGDTVEMRAVLDVDGTLTCGASVNGGAESTNTNSGANVFQAAWSAAQLNLNGFNSGATNPSFMAISSLKIASGVQSLATMRSL